MFFSQQILEQFCPTYKKAVLKFEKKYSAIPGEDDKAIKAKKKLIIKFAENYLTPKEIWDEYFRFPYDIVAVQEWKDEYKAAVEKSDIFHFYFNANVDSFIDLNKRTIRHQQCPYLHHGLYSDDVIRPRFTYPHLEIEKEYRLLAEFSSNPITKEENERFKFMLDLLGKIIAAEEEGDAEKWFDLLKKAKNINFLVHSVEYRLGPNLNNIKLWKLYIEFCKQQESKKDLLNLYSKYCRYFLDDKETKKEYENAVKNYDVSNFDNEVEQKQSRNYFWKKNPCHCVNWKNIFKFEKNVPIKIPKFLPLFSSSRVIKPTAEFIKPNFEIYHNQTFPFKTPIMTYLLKHRSPQLLHKLHKCCKFFFVIYPYPVCHRFCARDKFLWWEKQSAPYPVTFYSQSLVIRDLSSIIKFKNRIIVSNSFNLNSEIRDLLSHIRKYLFSCEAKYIRLRNQNLTFKELEFLIGHGNIEGLVFFDVKIYDDNNLCPMEEILRMIPKIIELQMSMPFITPETFQIMSKLKFHNCIKKFVLDRIDNTLLEPNEFLIFLKKNFKPYFHVYLDFIHGNPVFREFMLNNYETNKTIKKNYILKVT